MLKIHIILLIITLPINQLFIVPNESSIINYVIPENEQQINMPESLNYFRANAQISFHKYNRYPTIKNYLKMLASTNPRTVTLTRIGKSFEKRNILAVKISSGGKNKPVILNDAGIYAREWAAPAAALYIIKQLVQNGSNSNMFKSVNWYIIPLLNVDGYEYSHLMSKTWRKTRSRGRVCKGVDANRNFNFHWKRVGRECEETYSGLRPFSEIETRALRNFAIKYKKHIKLYVTFHSVGPKVLYPWAYTKKLPKNAKELHSLALKFKKAIYSFSRTKYVVGSTANLLYTASGGSDDWMMGYLNVSLCYTIELDGRGYGHQPPASKILPIVKEIFPGIKVFHNYIQNKYSK